jgi:hypothetical protein
VCVLAESARLKLSDDSAMEWPHLHLRHHHPTTHGHHGVPST